LACHLQIDADPDPGPDPDYHFDANLDPDPTLKFDTDPSGIHNTAWRANMFDMRYGYVKYVFVVGSGILYRTVSIGVLFIEKVS
jgi:hypothetical protein